MEQPKVEQPLRPIGPPVFRPTAPSAEPGPLGVFVLFPGVFSLAPGVWPPAGPLFLPVALPVPLPSPLGPAFALPPGFVAALGDRPATVAVAARGESAASGCPAPQPSATATPAPPIPAAKPPKPPAPPRQTPGTAPPQTTAPTHRKSPAHSTTHPPIGPSPAPAAPTDTAPHWPAPPRSPAPGQSAGVKHRGKTEAKGRAWRSGETKITGHSHRSRNDHSNSIPHRIAIAALPPRPLAIAVGC